MLTNSLVINLRGAPFGVLFSCPKLRILSSEVEHFTRNEGVTGSIPAVSNQYHATHTVPAHHKVMPCNPVHFSLFLVNALNNGCTRHSTHLTSLVMKGSPVQFRQYPINITQRTQPQRTTRLCHVILYTFHCSL